MRNITLILLSVLLFCCDGQFNIEEECKLVSDMVLKEHKSRNILSSELRVCYGGDLPELDEQTKAGFRKVKRVTPSPPPRPFHTAMLLGAHISELVGKNILTKSDSTYLVQRAKDACNAELNSGMLDCISERFTESSDRASIIDEPRGEYMKISSPIFNEDRSVMLLFIDKDNVANGGATGEVEVYYNHNNRWKLIWAMTRWME